MDNDNNEIVQDSDQAQAQEQTQADNSSKPKKKNRTRRTSEETARSEIEKIRDEIKAKQKKLKELKVHHREEMIKRVWKKVKDANIDEYAFCERWYSCVDGIIDEMTQSHDSDESE